MTPQEFLDEFGTLAESAEGVPKLRELILELAHTGRLTEHDNGNDSAATPRDRLQYEHRERWESEQIAKFEAKGKHPKNDKWKSKYQPPVLPDRPLPTIPDSWAWVTIELVCPIFVDSPHKTPVYSSRGQFPALRPRDVTDGILNVAGAKLVDEDQFNQQSERRVLTAGDVVYSRELSYGWAVIIPEGLKACLSQGMVSMRPHDLLDTGFFVGVLNGPIGRSQAHDSALGAAHPHVNLKDIRQFAIPLPPLAEQHRIVSKVDELMGLCDRLEAVQGERRAVRVRLNRSSLDCLTSVSTARGSGLSAAWQRVCDHFEVLYDTPETLPDLRQTILQLAVQGKLVPQDPNDEPADIAALNAARISLAKSLKLRSPKALNHDGGDAELPAGWISVPIGLTGIAQTGSTPKKNEPDNFGGPVPFIKPGDISDHDVRYDNESLSLKGRENGRHVPANSLLMVCIGGSLGKATLVDRDVSCNQQINYLTPTPLTSPDYLLIAIRSPDFQAEAWARAGVGTLPIVSKSKWEGISIAIPPLLEQKRIVSKVTHLLSQSPAWIRP